MGAWGTGLFSDDTAAEIRDAYRELIAGGASDADATIQLQARFLTNEPEIRAYVEPIFWLVLARTQWEIGRLDDQTRARAIAVIDSGQDIERWRSSGASSADIRKRAKVLDALRKTLHSPQKPRKELHQRKKRLSPYQVGDVVQFRLSTGRLVLFRVTSIHHDPEGDYPIAEILDWVGTCVPSVAEMAGLRCRQAIKVRGWESMRNPRLLLYKFPRDGFDRSRIEVVARGLSMPKIRSESFSMYDWADLERALEDDFGLK